VSAGYRDVMVASADAAEARLVPGANVVGCAHLGDVVRHHGGSSPVSDAVDPVALPAADTPRLPTGDLADVIGQHEARLALEVAASGGHHLLMVGPPGACKTMLAARLPGILPDLTDSEAVEVTSVHSVAGSFDPGAGLLRRPPFEDPHHTATPAAIVGGGSGVARPGAVSRAHRGVLFLDEAPEFAPRVLQTLRQPLESGELVLHRTGGATRYPARFQLVLAANPCPCGMASTDAGLECGCAPLARRRYLGRLSGPLLDRIDLQVRLEQPTRAERVLADGGESSATVAARVRAAREAARDRLGGTPWQANSELPGPWLRERLRGERQVLARLERQIDTGTLSLRGADRLLRVAWTIAELDGRGVPQSGDVDAAVVFRMGEHRG
jgi:magnesium chelatase family protein